ncbi:MAG TPA: class E sortase [Acidothermaceae bacterium]
MTTSSDFVFARASRANQTIRLLGELLITLGAIVFLFIGYELWFTGLYTEHAQSNFKKQLAAEWASPAPPTTSAGPASSASPSSPASGSPSPTSVPVASAPTVAPIALPGDAIGIIRIPRLGTKYGYAIVEGVSTDDLKKGPGHYPGTANPGGIGNFVVSGHRTTYLAPFNGLGELVVGDAIVIETRDTWYTYLVTKTQAVLPTDTAVVLPVPGQPRARPTQALITLTTCTPKYSASHRLIVTGLLQSALPKSAGSPPALVGG